MRKFNLLWLAIGVMGIIALTACGNNTEQEQDSIVQTDDSADNVITENADVDDEIDENDNDYSDRSELFDEHLEWAIGRIDSVLDQLSRDSILEARLALSIISDGIENSLPTIEDEIFFTMTELSLHLDSIIEALDGVTDDAWLAEVDDVFSERLEEMRVEIEALR